MKPDLLKKLGVSMTLLKRRRCRHESAWNFNFLYKSRITVYTIISYQIHGHVGGVEQQYDSGIEFKCTDKEYLGDVNGVIR